MTDFIFSSISEPLGLLTKNLQSIYNNVSPKVYEYHGIWGSLAVSENIFKSFQPLETEKHIFVVINGPILRFQDNHFLSSSDPVAGTKSIYKRWITGKIKWEEDLSGPFAILIIEKNSADITWITDLMSFIPVFANFQNNQILLSTHVDMLARTCKSPQLDLTAIAEFVTSNVITYPYTFYKEIIQLDPATEFSFTATDKKLRKKTYWVPIEGCLYSHVNEAAEDLKNSLSRYVNFLTESVNTIAMFLSGGEDSRSILSLMPSDRETHCFILLESMNREGRIAASTVRKFNAKFNYIKRHKTRYLDIFKECSDLVGSGVQYIHAHTYGYHSSHSFNKYDAFLGGFAADRLLKGLYVPKIKPKKLPFVPEIKKFRHSYALEPLPFFINSSLASQIRERRSLHYRTLSTFRTNESLNEWFRIWPSSMAIASSYIHANRRLFRTYEPFLDNKVVHTAAKVPQKWKLNRKLFQKAMALSLKPSKFILHSSRGSLPYYPWYLNIFISPIVRNIWILRSKIFHDSQFQGSWQDWDYLLKSRQWHALMEYGASLSPLADGLFYTSASDLLKSDRMTTLQKLNLVQAMYHISVI